MLGRNFKRPHSVLLDRVVRALDKFPVASALCSRFGKISFPFTTGRNLEVGRGVVPGSWAIFPFRGTINMSPLHSSVVGSDSLLIFVFSEFLISLDFLFPKDFESYPQTAPNMSKPKSSVQTRRNTAPDLGKKLV